MSTNETILETTRLDVEAQRAAYAPTVGELALDGEEVGYGLEVEPIVEDYAQAPLAEAFDWQSILKQAVEKRQASDDGYYLVAFRSHLKEDADTELLTELDAEAHAAALESPALLHYFADEPNEEGRAVSFCLWSDRAAAQEASRDPRHMAAMKMVRMYQSYSFERHLVSLAEDGVDFNTL